MLVAQAGTWKLADPDELRVALTVVATDTTEHSEVAVVVPPEVVGKVVRSVVETVEVLVVGDVSNVATVVVPLEVARKVVRSVVEAVEV